jgi:hypothetical protein
MNGSQFHAILEFLGIMDAHRKRQRREHRALHMRGVPRLLNRYRSGASAKQNECKQHNPQ